jgi:hypothetical protein
MTQELLDTTQQSSGGRIIAFESAQVVPGIVNGTHFLVVSGQAPCLNMEVSVVPLIYVSCPEFWEIEVVGTLPSGFCLPAIRQYTVTIPLTGIVGSKGVEVVGANGRERFEVDGGCA